MKNSLEKIRRKVNPTRQGILECAAAMGRMLDFGWKKDRLDDLEILFWEIRDAEGKVRK